LKRAYGFLSNCIDLKDAYHGSLFDKPIVEGLVDVAVDCPPLDVKLVRQLELFLWNGSKRLKKRV
jgi:hypothetical protein